MSLVCRITSNFFFSSVRTTQAQSSDQESDVTLGDPRSFLRLRRRPGGLRVMLRVQSRRRLYLAPSLGRWLHTRNNHASRPAVLVVESPQGVETLAPHLEHLTFTSQ